MTFIIKHIPVTKVSKNGTQYTNYKKVYVEKEQEEKRRQEEDYRKVEDLIL